MMKHGVFELVTRPAYVKNIIRPKLLFKIKMDGRYKTRLVAMGFTQRYGVDFDQTFAPCVRMSSIRTFCYIVVNEGLFLTAFDISAAFLYGDWCISEFLEGKIIKLKHT